MPQLAVVGWSFGRSVGVDGVVGSEDALERGRNGAIVDSEEDPLDTIELEKALGNRERFRRGDEHLALCRDDFGEEARKALPDLKLDKLFHSSAHS